MTEEKKPEVKQPEVKQPSADDLWAKTGKDIAATQAAESAPAEPAKAPEAKAADPADPMAGLPEPTRKLIEGLQTKLIETDGRFTKMNQQLATAHGTIGNLKQRLDASQVQLQTMTPTIEAVEAEKKKKEQEARAAKVAKRKALRERLSDLPDVAELMDEILPADDQPAKEAAKPEPKKEEKQADAKPADLAANEKALLVSQRELSDRHPKWMQTVNSQEFKAWSEAQPDDVRSLSASDSIDDADKMLTLFKKHKEDAAKVAQVEKDRQERLRRGEGPQGRGSSAAKVDTSKDALWEQTGRDFAKAQSG